MDIEQANRSLEVLRSPVKASLINRGPDGSSICLGQDFIDWAASVKLAQKETIKLVQSPVIYSFGCKKCGSVVSGSTSKTDFCDIVSAYLVEWANNLSWCDACKSAKEIEKMVEVIEFLDWLLDSSSESKPNYSDFSRLVREFNDVRIKDLEEVQYHSFLATNYWRTVANEVKRRAGHRCSTCGSKERLAAHHRSYSHRGRDHTKEGMKQLSCLCDKCHKKFHNIYE